MARIAITGAASGIGAAVRKRLEENGDSVIGVDDIAVVIEYLLGSGARYVRGSILYADGGTDATMRPDRF